MSFYNKTFVLPNIYKKLTKKRLTKDMWYVQIKSFYQIKVIILQSISKKTSSLKFRKGFQVNFSYNFFSREQNILFRTFKTFHQKIFTGLTIYYPLYFKIIGAITLEINSTFYHNNYGIYNFIADTQCDWYIFHTNESIQLCLISRETHPVKVGFFSNRKTGV